MDMYNLAISLKNLKHGEKKVIYTSIKGTKITVTQLENLQSMILQ